MSYIKTNVTFDVWLSLLLFSMQYDWDLAIKWVVLFIDGVNHAQWIVIKSDVDMEMV